MVISSQKFGIKTFAFGNENTQLLFKPSCSGPQQQPFDYEFHGEASFLSGVKTNKGTLFGSFSSDLSRDDKLEAWTKIVTNLQAHGVSLAMEKPVTYFRDTVWPNLRRYTLDKKEKKGQSGEGGGRGAKWTEVDHLVLDIIGKDSPAARGVPGGRETWEPEEATEKEEEQQQGSPPTTAMLQPREEENVPPRPQESSNRQPLRKAKRQWNNNFISEFRRKKLMKIDLEIENLRLRNALLQKQLEEPSCSTSTARPIIPDGDSSYQVL